MLLLKLQATRTRPISPALQHLLYVSRETLIVSFYLCKANLHNQNRHSTPIPDPGIPHRVHSSDNPALAAGIPSALDMALISAQAPSTQQQLAHNTSSDQNSQRTPLALVEHDDYQADPSNLQLTQPDQPQKDGARVPDASQPAQVPYITSAHSTLPILIPSWWNYAGTSAPYTWYHSDASPSLPNPANVNDPRTQLSLYELHIANVLSVKVTALMPKNSAVFVPIIDARNKFRMVLKGLPALAPKYCREFGKFTLRPTLTTKSLLQIHFSCYWAAIELSW